MKSLVKYVLQVKDNSLDKYLNEKLIITSKKRTPKKTIVVNSREELSDIINKRAYTDDKVFIKDIDLSDIDVSKLRDFHQLFQWWAFETIDISGWDTTNARDMSQMFYSCNKLTDIIGIDEIYINNVNNMSYMFAYCHNLHITDKIKHWEIDPRDVATVHMFLGCPTTLEWTDKH